MKYRQILEQIATKENTTPKQVEKEMKAALKAAGLDCHPKEFIEKASVTIAKRLYIV